MRWKTAPVAADHGPDPAAAARADLVRRDFAVNAAAISTRWCGDITYLPTWEGWLYLATVIDIASRRVVGLALAEHLRTELVADALTNAVAARDPAPGVVFHADRGCQDTSGDFATLAEDLAVTLSSGRTGQCWDNALAESFFASLKGECLDQQPWPTRTAACGATVEYIAWYVGEAAAAVGLLVGSKVRGELIHCLEVRLDGAGRLVPCAQVSFEGSRQVVYAMRCHGPLRFGQTGHVRSMCGSRTCGERALCSPLILAETAITAGQRP